MSCIVCVVMAHLQASDLNLTIHILIQSNCYEN